MAKVVAVIRDPGFNDVNGLMVINIFSVIRPEGEENFVDRTIDTQVETDGTLNSNQLNSLISNALKAHILGATEITVVNADIQIMKFT